MNSRHEGLRGTAGHAVPLWALRCAALLAVLMWVLPVCTDASPGGSHAVAAASGQAVTAVAGAAAAAEEAGHVCPDARHRPGVAHCRLATGAVPNSASPVPVPRPRTVDVCAARAPDAPPGPVPAAGLTHTPGIHQLQVQRT
ncbi:hypothetical protein [Streptomyces sp. NPDC102462]|uniref:hypothetical protein n=1 Tax=Streptomyces sp. NPDC102462 TaxID=3366178 RepID=UPI00381A1AD7